MIHDVTWPPTFDALRKNCLVPRFAPLASFDPAGGARGKRFYGMVLRWRSVQNMLLQFRFRRLAIAPMLKAGPTVLELKLGLPARLLGSDEHSHAVLFRGNALSELE